MGEKQWNKDKQIWEKDCKPYAYRVTWRNIDTGEERERIFNDVDQGYSFYEMMQKDDHSIKATWDHIPPS